MTVSYLRLAEHDFKFSKSWFQIKLMAFSRRFLRIPKSKSQPIAAFLGVKLCRPFQYQDEFYVLFVLAWLKTPKVQCTSMELLIQVPTLANYKQILDVC